MSSDTLGIIAGGGALPRAVAEAVTAQGRAVFVLGLTGSADDWISRFPHEVSSPGEAGRITRALKAHGCNEVLLVGRVERPKFSDIKMDMKGAMLAPRVAAAALKGDDALLRVLVSLFEESGQRVVGVAEAAPSLLLGEGPIGRVRPAPEQDSDIALGFKVVRALGALDVGQAAAVCAGLVLAVEAAEGTDAMIRRIADLPEHIRGRPGKPHGVLVKAPKPVQDGKTDLPVLGVATVRNAQAAGLAGIAAQAGATLIVDRAEVIAAADEAGLFLTGIAESG